MNIEPLNTPNIRLDELIRGEIAGVDQRKITGIALDSRKIKPNWLYVALPGTKSHGARYADQAIALGAAAIMTDAVGAGIIETTAVPILVADDVRKTMGRVSARLFGQPAQKLNTVGITGTNGKTTTAFLTASALSDRHTATIGTIGFRLDGVELVNDRSTVTTPESPDLQALLAVMVDR
ncbi:MAG: UDP-N-acetylmuramoyl-L-alanyl-D-glutamate--2,6-diaminopimelate ligase, partial [Propionibacterium sp.]